MCIHGSDKKNNFEFFWEIDEFRGNFKKMKQLFHKFRMNKGKVGNLPLSNDPFRKNLHENCLIGISKIPLEELYHYKNIKSSFELRNFLQINIGSIEIKIINTDSVGLENKKDNITERKVGENLYFKLFISKVEVYEKTYKNVMKFIFSLRI